MNTIQILVGPIASGKSTYARKQGDVGALIVSHDSLTEMLHGTYRYEAALRAAYREMEESLVLATLKAGRDVVIDRTHLTRESRLRWVNCREYLTYVRGCRYNIVAVVFPVESPEVHAKRRFEVDARGRSYEQWLAVAKHHAEQWSKESISESERFDDIIYRGFRRGGRAET